eukprot:TRINITY_DN17341_c0_g1_i3.p2 TRINITY_DN17341_c0_g1~~TRINITY_DN17341_c0_g1_i3.p2  ORF type:complete len:200 (+),score=54.99 TRINITY_DN17341_c0_g1_i3:80-601(+)
MALRADCWALGEPYSRGEGRLLHLRAPTLPDLGRALWAAYGERIQAGLGRARERFLRCGGTRQQPPWQPFDAAEWAAAAARIELGARMHCPRAHALFSAAQGAAEGGGGAVWPALLDWELWAGQMAGQRRSTGGGGCPAPAAAGAGEALPGRCTGFACSAGGGGRWRRRSTCP